METTFLTSERKIVHKFENGVKITTDFNFNICYVDQNGKSISFSIEDMSIEDYHKILKKWSDTSTQNSRT